MVWSYKTRDIASSYNKKRINGHFRRQIISFSQKRATKDKNDRDILIQNFTKKMNKDNLVSCDDLRDLKNIILQTYKQSAFYELDIENNTRRSKFWWILCLRNKRTDLSLKEVIHIYIQKMTNWS